MRARRLFQKWTFRAPFPNPRFCSPTSQSVDEVAKNYPLKPEESRKAPRVSERLGFLSPGPSDRHFLTVVRGLCFGRGNHPDRSQQAPVVPPINPLQRAELDVVETAPRSPVADQLGLVEPDHRLGERVVIGIAAAADALDTAGIANAFGVADR